MYVRVASSNVNTATRPFGATLCICTTNAASDCRTRRKTTRSRNGRLSCPSLGQSRGARLLSTDAKWGASVPPCGHGSPWTNTCVIPQHMRTTLPWSSVLVKIERPSWSPPYLALPRPFLPLPLSCLIRLLLQATLYYRDGPSCSQDASATITEPFDKKKTRHRQM